MRLSDLVKRHLGKAIFIFVSGYSLVYAIAFIQLYSMEHPYRRASAWIYENVPPGSTIVSPHWDDKVPVTLPGPGNRVPQIYKMDGREFELPVYEQDTPQNIQLLLRRIAAADYLSFATPRTPDSIPRIEKEYPRTTAIIQLLWAEKLGFSFATAIKNRPTFLGLTFNDDLADESFSVYDHPKAVIFKNEERLSPEELFSRVMRVDEYRPLPTMNEILLMDRGGWKPKESFWKPAWTVAARSITFVALLGIGVWALLVRPALPLALIGFGVALGAFAATAVTVVASIAGVLPFSGSAGRFVALGIVVLGVVRVALQSKVRERLLSSVREHGVWLLLTIIATALIVRSVASPTGALPSLGDPDSFNYLGHLTRTESLSFEAVLRAGPLGCLAFPLAWVLKATAVPFPMLSEVATMVLAFVQGCVTYTLFAMLMKKRIPAAIGAVLVAVPAAYVLFGATVGQDTILMARAHLAPERARFVRWATTRIPGAPTFIEACEDSTVKGVAALAGFAVLGDSVMEGDSRLCSMVDASAVFQSMMRRGVQFFVTPSPGKAVSKDSTARLTAFDGRRDLFSKLYEDESVTVYVPAFSRYFSAGPQPG